MAEVLSGEGEPTEGETPGFDEVVVDDDGEGDGDSQGAQVFGGGVFPHELEHAWSCSVTADPPVAADGPLDPHHRNSQKDQGAEVGDQEGAAAVGRSLDGKAEEVPQTDGVAGDGQDQTDAATPVFPLPLVGL